MPQRPSRQRLSSNALGSGSVLWPQPGGKVQDSSRDAYSLGRSTVLSWDDLESQLGIGPAPCG